MSPLDWLVDAFNSQWVLPGGQTLLIREVVGNAFRKQDVSGIAAVHDALRHIDSAARHVEVGVDVGDAIDGAGVYAHAEGHVRPAFEHAGYFHGALHGQHQVLEKHERHAVARRQGDDLVALVGPLVRRRVADDFDQRLNAFADKLSTRRK